MFRLTFRQTKTFLMLYARHAVGRGRPLHAVSTCSLRLLGKGKVQVNTAAAAAAAEDCSTLLLSQCV